MPRARVPMVAFRDDAGTGNQHRADCWIGAGLANSFGRFKQSRSHEMLIFFEPAHHDLYGGWHSRATLANTNTARYTILALISSMRAERRKTH